MTATEDGAHSPNQLTIEQLAARSGMTVRNIRSHQARGLLSPPEVRLRVGYYGPDHLAQLQVIRDLQREGFNLGGIKRLMQDTEETAERLLRFKASLAHLGEEPPERLTAAELGRRFRVEPKAAAEVLARAEALGVLVPVGEGSYEAPSPSLLAVAEEAVRRGIELDTAFGLLEQLDEHCGAISDAFVRLFITQVWEPFRRADMPAEGWPELDEATRRLVPLASDALVAVFARRMRARLADAFERIELGRGGS